jgi:hypothetical protein
MCANRHNPRFFRKVVTMPIIFEKQTKKKAVEGIHYHGTHVGQ